MPITPEKIQEILLTSTDLTYFAQEINKQAEGNKNDMTLEQLVCFCVLMENGQGIVGKAPSYLFEKFKAVQHRDSRDSLLGLLDLHNANKFREYIKTWRVDE